MPCTMLHHKKHSRYTNPQLPTAVQSIIADLILENESIPVSTKSDRCAWAISMRGKQNIPPGYWFVWWNTARLIFA